MPEIRLKINATLKEDAHPGSGAGSAGVDALVSRDRRDRPVIWASHLEGLLRKAARSLWGEAEERRLFGAAGGQRQPAVFTSLYADSDPESRVWRSSARESYDNRAPKDDTLRSVELVPKGTTFTGWVELPDGDGKNVVRLLKEVDAIGRGRQSGAGRVSFQTEPAQLDRREVGNATCRLLLLLRNLDPLCIAATATPGNIIPTLAFVPGRTLLGALAGWLMAEGKKTEAAHFVTGKIRVSDALPLPEVEPVPSLASVEVSPAPLALKSEKPKGVSGAIPWWATPMAPPRRLNADGHRGEKLKRPESDLFLYRSLSSRDGWRAYRPEIRVRLRNGRPARNQLDPSLFSIEEIAERTCFLAEIRGEQGMMDAIARALGPVLKGGRWLRVGRSGTPVEIARIEWAGNPEDARVENSAYLTLTSDWLLRDENLRWLTALRPEDFPKIPGWPRDVAAEVLFQDETRVSGFNGTSRLWRLPLAGVRRGSVFKVTGGLSTLAALAANGQALGERTHEGFGRFRLDADLPGVSHREVNFPESLRMSPDVAEEAIAATTRKWWDDHRTLANSGEANQRRPSLSQWQTLVAELTAGDADGALSRREARNIATAGASGWRDGDAQAILQNLRSTPAPVRAAHARMFVRWLRTGMRGGT